MDWGAHLASWITIALVAGAFLFARRYGGGSALESLERSNRVLEDDNKRLTLEVASLREEVAELRASRDVSLAIAPVLEALKLHEERASVRSDATLRVLEMIAARLGTEAEAA